MPQKMERALKREAKKKFGSTTSPQARRYIYGTMQKRTNWKPHHSAPAGKWLDERAKELL